MTGLPLAKRLSLSSPSLCRRPGSLVTTTREVSKSRSTDLGVEVVMVVVRVVRVVTHQHHHW